MRTALLASVLAGLSTGIGGLLRRLRGLRNLRRFRLRRSFLPVTARVLDRGRVRARHFPVTYDAFGRLLFRNVNNGGTLPDSMGQKRGLNEDGPRLTDE